jgi:hypothetical protein
MDLTNLATGLLNRYRAVGLASGPKAREIALAHFKGMCDAAYRLGLGMTPDAVFLAVLDTITSSDPRPAFSATGSNEALKAYDAEQAASLADVLKGL